MNKIYAFGIVVEGGYNVVLCLMSIYHSHAIKHILNSYNAVFSSIYKLKNDIVICLCSLNKHPWRPQNFR